MHKLFLSTGWKTTAKMKTGYNPRIWLNPWLPNSPKYYCIEMALGNGKFCFKILSLKRLILYFSFFLVKLGLLSIFLWLFHLNNCFSHHGSLRSGVTLQSAVSTPHTNNSSPAVHSEDRRPLAICVRNLPARSSG